MSRFGRKERGERRWGAAAKESALARAALLGPPHGEPEAVRRQLRELAKALDSTRDDAAAAVAWALALDERARLKLIAQQPVCNALRARLESACAEAADIAGERGAKLLSVVGRVREGRRRAALAEARALLAQGEDPELAEIAALVVTLAVRGPRLDLQLAGEPALEPTMAKLLESGAVRIAFGERVSIGRVGAVIVVDSPAVAPEHASIWRDPAKGIVLGDAGTTAGTTQGGAPLVAPFPVGAGLRVELGGRVPLVVAPLDPTRSASPLVVDAAGRSYLAPLGVLAIGQGGTLRDPGGPRWVLWMEETARARREAPPADAFLLPWVVLRAPVDARAHLGASPAAAEVDLCFGDALREEADGAPVLAIRAPLAAP